MKNWSNKMELEEDAEFKITKNSNDWKFEFSLKHRGFQFIRGKVYDKSAEKWTSCGVSNTKIQDP